MFQYSNLEFKLTDQQKDHSSIVDSLNEQISTLKKSINSPKADLPVNLNESIIMELKTELYDKKVFVKIIKFELRQFYKFIFNIFYYLSRKNMMQCKML